MKTQEVFNKFLAEIQEQVSPTTYATWFKGLELISMDDKNITIKVPLAVHKQILKLQYLMISMNGLWDLLLVILKYLMP